MTRYWVIAPVEAQPSDFFDQIWKFDFENDVISIGLSVNVDVSKIDRNSLAEMVSSQFYEKPKQTQGLITNMIWSFYNEIKPGDIILARRGRKVLQAVGTVREPAVYDPGRNNDIDHPHFLPISWHPSPREKDFGAVVFPMHTLAEINQHQFDNIVEGTGFEAAEVADETAPGSQSQFVFEKYLEEFIVSNFSSIFDRNLVLYQDEEGNTGQQYQTDVGYIDILAKDVADESLVVIELKKGRPSDSVVGQIMRYMGWVNDNVAKEGQLVRGLVICQSEDIKMSYALKMIDNVDVKYYKVSYSLSDSS